MQTLVFDIETVPDTELGRRLYGISDLPDKQVADIMYAKRRQETGGEFLPHEQHRVVAISVALRERDHLKVWSLGGLEATEKEIIDRFYDGLERYTPDLVSWNGSGFDMPVLHYRSLLHGVTAARYWETGDHDQSFRWNNYLSRFHWRHLDLMDILSGFQNRGRASLQSVATLLGFPGKIGMSGADVWDAYQRGELAAIRRYCEADVLNTYLIYLRFELVRGKLTPLEYTQEIARVRQFLADSDAIHWKEFAAAWPAA
jgi:3'-5' exonuclease